MVGDSTAASSAPDYMADSPGVGAESEATVATDDVKLTEKAPDQPVDRSTPPSNMAATNPTGETTSRTPMEDQAALRMALHSWASIAVDMTMLHGQLQAQQRVLDSLVSQTKECPSCIWLYPKRRDLRDWLRQPMERLFMDSLMLVFVCPVTLKVVECGPDKVGYEVKKPKEFVKRWGPAILATIAVLEAATAAGRVVGIPLPSLPSVKTLTGGAISLAETLGFGDVTNRDLVKEALQSMSSLIGEAMEQGASALQTATQQSTSPVERTSTMLTLDCTDEAYRWVHDLVLPHGPLADQLRGKMHRLLGDDGAVEWVSVEGEDAWKQAHRLSPPPPTPTPPSSSTSTSTSVAGVLPVPLVPPLPSAAPTANTANTATAEPHNDFVEYLRTALGRHHIHDERLLAPAVRLMAHEGISSHAVWTSLSDTDVMHLLSTEDGLKLKVGVREALKLIHAEAKTAKVTKNDANGDGEKSTKDVSQLQKEIQELKRQLRLMTPMGRAEDVDADGYDAGNGQCQLLAQSRSTSVKSSSMTPAGRQEQIIRLERQVAAIDRHVHLMSEHLHGQDTR
eukprot:gene10735-7641_t